MPAPITKHDQPNTPESTARAPGARTITRRQVLVVGGAGLAAVAIGLSSTDIAKAATATTKKKNTPKTGAKSTTTVKKKTTPTTALASNPSAATAATTRTSESGLGGLLPANACVLSPEMTEGPFYLDINKIRSDITEARPGTPLALSLTVMSATTCKPIVDAAVDIWHTDALGTYSGVQGNAGIFMRGTQRSDANGVVQFKTVYPGWYNGRTVHIHVMVHVGGNSVHTGQLFFDDAITDEAYKAAPYNTRGTRTQRNSNDGIHQGGGASSTLKPTKSATGYSASLAMGVQA